MKSFLMLVGLAIAAVTVAQVLFLYKYTQQPTIQSSLRHPNRIFDLPSDTYSLAQSQSFGFFDDITRERWMLHQKIYREYTKHKTPHQPLMFNPAIETRTEHWWNSAEAWYQNVRTLRDIFIVFMYTTSVDFSLCPSQRTTSRISRASLREESIFQI